MKVVPIPEKTQRCRQCHQMREWNPCFYCIRTCKRKKKYWHRELAERVLQRLSPKPWDDPTLQVYHCRVTHRPHWHLGHAGGRFAQRLRKRAEKMRRKELLKAHGFG